MELPSCESLSGKVFRNFFYLLRQFQVAFADFTLMLCLVGNHSQSHLAKIAPAIEELMVRQNLTAYLDPNNSGVLIVQLNGQGGKGSREVVQDLERQGGTGCLVM